MPAIELAIRNFPAQQKIFDSNARYKIAVKGRRFGLTKGAANDFIRGALDRKYKQGFWGDTINSNIDRYVDRYFIKELKKLPDHLWHWSKQQKTLHMLDSYIDFRSADNPENWEGFGYDKVFLNEAGIILKNPYLWHNAVQPMLMEFKPSSVIGGTPKGMGLFHDLAMKAKDGDNKAYKYFHFTTYDNPYLDKNEIDRMAKDMPEHVRRQEIFAEFLEDIGAVFRNVRRVMTAEPKKPQVGHLYVMGVDLAKVQDYTVITVYDRANNCQVYQSRFNQLEWPFQKKKIAETAKHYNNALCVLDATGLGDPIADDLRRAGVAIEPFKLTNTSKKEIIEKLAIWIEQQKLKMIDLQETVDELTSFTYDVSSTGVIRYNAPVGLHDDIVIAHALAVTHLHEVIRVVQEEKPRIRLELEKRLNSFGSEFDEGEYYDDF